LSSVAIPPSKGLEAPDDDPNEKLEEGVGPELLCPNKPDDVDGAELNENPLSDGRGSAGLFT